MATANQLIDYHALREANRALIEADKATIRDTLAAAGTRISTRGKLFTLPDGTAHPGPLSVIILDHISTNTLYEGTYKPGVFKPPSCFAIGKDKHNNLAPSSEVLQPKASSCNDCPMNKWGSAAGGGKGKACKNEVRLAVVPPDANENADIRILAVSPTGLGRYRALVDNLLNDYDAIPLQMIVEISFDPNQDFPTLIFDPVGLHENPAVFKLREDAQTLLNRTPNFGDN